MTIDLTRPTLTVEHGPRADALGPAAEVVEADLLAALRPRLVDVLPEDEVDQRVHDALVALGPVRVTTYLPILVERRVRAQLRTTA
jgi:hypothetical protein